MVGHIFTIYPMSVDYVTNFQTSVFDFLDALKLQVDVIFSVVRVLGIRVCIFTPSMSKNAIVATFADIESFAVTRVNQSIYVPLYLICDT